MLSTALHRTTAYGHTTDLHGGLEVGVPAIDPLHRLRRHGRGHCRCCCGCSLCLGWLCMCVCVGVGMGKCRVERRRTLLVVGLGEREGGKRGRRQGVSLLHRPPPKRLQPRTRRREV